MATTLPPAEQICVRERLLSAAEMLVSREGVGNLTLDAVAKEAGVSKGGLLYHFPNKRSLIVAYVERLAQKCDAEHTKAMTSETSSPGAFTRAYLTARLRPLEPKEEVIHSALLAAAATDPEYLEPFRRRLIEWQTRLEDDQIDPATATIVRLAIDGLCLGKIFGMPVPEGEFRKRVIDKLLAITRNEQLTSTKEEL